MSAKDQLLDFLNQLDKGTVDAYTNAAIQYAKFKQEKDVARFEAYRNMHNTLELVIANVKIYTEKMREEFSWITDMVSQAEIEDERFIKYLDKKIRDWKLYHGSNEVE
ncbi:MAG: hypothetical protein M0R17_00875 [Candidatus Omnitrophica bacterium]|jgi:hypothetical protein|nr:hypothetical protein [Candidatus Omnitrophota bacterium]